MKRNLRLLLVLACLTATGRFAEAAWTGVNYQGRLLVDGAPYTGPTNVQFLVYTQLVGGTAVYVEFGDAIAVVDGLYTTVMGDNPSPSTPMAFQEALGLAVPLYLELSVGKTALSPREQLNAVPYAMDADLLDNMDSSRFLTSSGGTMANSTAAPVLEVTQSGTTANSHGIKGFTSSSAAGAAGVYGLAVAPATGIPVEGEVGVRGESSTGAGVAGLSLQDAGVYAMSSNSVGVEALSFNDYGLHAASLRTNAIFAEGSIKADKLVYTRPRTNYYTVGSHEFQTRGNVDMDNDTGIYLFSNPGLVYAPLHLPHGATVIRFDARVYDSHPSANLNIILQRFAVLGSGSAPSELGQVTSSGSSGWQNLSDTTIDPGAAVVDNSSYFYSAYCYSTAWSDTNKWYTVRITYTVDEAP
ncbi:MAG: hypothetical protein AB7V14_03735 [Kiritimatiellia bacterium]